MIRLADGRELRLREFGTRQAAWAKLVETSKANEEETIATLGPEAWPSPPALLEPLALPRPLHSLIRDQRILAGVGRSWADEILHTARLSPFKRGDGLTSQEAEALRAAMVDRLGNAVAHYEEVLSIPIPDKLPMPLTVHRHRGEPCPRCGTRIEAVRFEDYELCYCPQCQTQGKLLKDRRLSRILK